MKAALIVVDMQEDFCPPVDSIYACYPAFPVLTMLHF